MAYTRRITLGLSTAYFGEADNLDVYFIDDDGNVTPESPIDNGTNPGMIKELTNGTEAEAMFLVILPIESGFAGAIAFADAGGIIKTISVDPEEEYINDVKDKTDNLPPDTSQTLTEMQSLISNVPGNVWDRVIETSYSALAMMRLFGAVLLGKASNSGATFRDINDTKARVTATVDSSGNRTVVTKDAS